MKNIIEIKNINKIFKSRKNKNFITTIWDPQFEFYMAVNNISLEIKKGESVAFLGPNGAGKTTTIKMMSGLIYPTDGEINILGYKPAERNKFFLKKNWLGNGK